MTAALALTPPPARYKGWFTVSQVETERFFEKTMPEPNSGCLLWLASASDKGYGRFSIRMPNGEKRPMVASRVAWVIANGPIPEGLWVLHKCDNPYCVEVAHLFLGTVQDNNEDMRAKGRAYQKLTPPEVEEIRELFAGGTSKKKLAARYSVGRRAIKFVVEGRSHRHA